MVKYYDISDWEKQPHFGTGGTRDKEVVEDSKSGILYFFKTSLRKMDKDYRYEFWSEVIASEIGELLGFRMLHYDVACNKGRLGCLSKSMVETGMSELQECSRWLKGYAPAYDENDRNAYTFQLIEAMLKDKFPERRFIDDLIEVVVFDSIIGNEDRHQENWSIIVSKRQVPASGRLLRRQTADRIVTDYSFAPIYDSGSSLGRELRPDKVARMLKDRNELDAYINRGKSEIRWDGEAGKQRHFDLIRKISEAGHRDCVLSVLRRVSAMYDAAAVSQTIDHIDDCLPMELCSEKIPAERKELLKKLVSLRVGRLKSLET